MSSAIEEKKENEEGFQPDFKSFIKNYMSSIIVTIGICVFVIGTIGLYNTKIAQANILPDDITKAPFAEIDRIVKDVPIDINISRSSFFSDNKDTLSQKAIFQSREYLDSFRKGLSCYLKESATPNSGMFSNALLFFSYVCDNLISKNFMAFNTIFMNLSFLPESIIMLLYGFFGIFLWIGIYFFNVCISIFYHFVHIPQLFRAESESNKEKWESEEDISFFHISKLIAFFFLWIPIGVFSTFVTPFFFTIYAIIAPLYATYKITNKQKIVDGVETSYNLFDFIKDTFTYKKFFFFLLSTISLISNGVKYLGNNALYGIIIAVIFAFIMGLYNNELPTNGVDGFTSKIRQSIKKASIIETNKTINICKKEPEQAFVEPIIAEPIIEDQEVVANKKQIPTKETMSEIVVPKSMQTVQVPNDMPNQQQGGKKRKSYNIRLT
jgi:hypothetical protein